VHLSIPSATMDTNASNNAKVFAPHLELPTEKKRFIQHKYYIPPDAPKLKKDTKKAGEKDGHHLIPTPTTHKRSPSHGMITLQISPEGDTKIKNYFFIIRSPPWNP
jgi:hypothetical protein